MPNQPTEQEKAALSQTRGKTMSALEKSGGLATPEAKQKFAAAQGTAEAAGKLTPARMQQLAAQGTMSFKHGGKVPGKKGEAVPIIAHAGETIIPADKSKGRNSEYRKVFVARQQTRQGGGNTPVKGEKHDSKKAEKGIAEKKA
jgi:hypothetical protein